MPKFLEKKNFKQIYVTPDKGNFALDNESVHWDHCREQFAPKMTDKIKGFYFSHNSFQSEKIAEFLNKFETVTGIPESCFSKTNKSEVIWVQPDPFWLNCELKRSLLTIVLRCGLNYYDNFDDALFDPKFKENQYARETKLAVMRFMFGFTFFTGVYKGNFGSVHKHGWREEFQNLDESTIRKLLVKPIGTPKEVSTIVGMESIWL